VSESDAEALESSVLFRAACSDTELNKSDYQYLPPVGEELPWPMQELSASSMVLDELVSSAVNYDAAPADMEQLDQLLAPRVATTKGALFNPWQAAPAVDDSFDKSRGKSSVSSPSPSVSVPASASDNQNFSTKSTTPESVQIAAAGIDPSASATATATATAVAGPGSVALGEEIIHKDSNSCYDEIVKQEGEFGSQGPLVRPESAPIIKSPAAVAHHFVDGNNDKWPEDLVPTALAGAKFSSVNASPVSDPRRSSSSEDLLSQSRLLSTDFISITSSEGASGSPSHMRSKSANS
jgi:hypothetical protein